ncbi:MAG TPA: DUF3352 domain-containing protein, partial [Thermomicrobiales bacterium]|nr:DUF3352 domain-containing protein [Thermomicrobiales bacterium]
MQTIDVGKTAGNWRERIARLAVAGSLFVGTIASALPAAAQGTPTAGGTPLAAGAAPATAKAAPADAAAFITFDTNTNSPQWTQAADLLARLGMPNAADMWKAKAAEHESNGMGTPPTQAQVDALTGGQIAVAVTSQAAVEAIQASMSRHGEQGSMESQAMADMHDVHGVAAIVQPSDPDVAWSYVQQQFGNMAQQMGAQVAQTQVDGVDVISVSPAPGATPAASPVAMEQGGSMYGMDMGHRHGGAAARVDNLIVAGPTADDLKPFLDAATGGAPSLAASPELADVQANLPTQQGLVFAYANTAGIVDGLDPQIKEALRSMSPTLQDEAAWKLHLGVVGWADANGFRLDSIAIGANGYDLSKVVPPNKALTVDQKVPADTLLFSGGYQLPGAWDSLALSLAQAVNQGMAEMGMGTPTAMPMATPTSMGQMFSPAYIEQQIAQATQTLGFNPRDELFGQFQGEYVFAVGAPSFGAGGFDLAAIFATELGDPSKVQPSIDKLARLIGSLAIKNSTTTTIAERQVGADKVYSIKDSAMPNLPVEFGIVNGHFVVGIGKGVDEFASGATSNLASSSQYQQVMALLPSDHFAVSYIDLKQIVTLATAFSGMGGAATRDANAACGNFPDQAAAQAAYDADPMTNMDLDQNFNGQACEDFFAAASPEAT